MIEILGFMYLWSQWEQCQKLYWATALSHKHLARWHRSAVDMALEWSGW